MAALQADSLPLPDEARLMIDALPVPSPAEAAGAPVEQVVQAERPAAPPAPHTLRACRATQMMTASSTGNLTFVAYSTAWFLYDHGSLRWQRVSVPTKARGARAVFVSAELDLLLLARDDGIATCTGLPSLACSYTAAPLGAVSSHARLRNAAGPFPLSILLATVSGAVVVTLASPTATPAFWTLGGITSPVVAVAAATDGGWAVGTAGRLVACSLWHTSRVKPGGAGDNPCVPTAGDEQAQRTAVALTHTWFVSQWNVVELQYNTSVGGMIGELSPAPADAAFAAGAVVSENVRAGQTGTSPRLPMIVRVRCGSGPTVASIFCWCGRRGGEASLTRRAHSE
jgi:hypothetical protein